MSQNNKVLALPIQLGTHDEERAGIQSYFPENALPTDWGFMYHQTKIDHDEMFLCSNWAGHRVKQDLSVGKEYPFAKEDPLETVDYSVGLRDKLLAHLDLWDASRKKLKFIQECAATDNARMLIIWGIGERAPSEPEKAHIGHLSVKWNGRWESKLSTEYYVITHNEESFRKYAGNKLYPAVYYKRT